MGQILLQTLMFNLPLTWEISVPSNIYILNDLKYCCSCFCSLWLCTERIPAQQEKSKSFKRWTFMTFPWTVTKVDGKMRRYHFRYYWWIRTDIIPERDNGLKWLFQVHRFKLSNARGGVINCVMLVCFLKRTDLPEGECSWFISINPRYWLETPNDCTIWKKALYRAVTWHTACQPQHTVWSFLKLPSQFFKRNSFLNQVVSIPLHHWLRHQHVLSRSFSIRLSWIITHAHWCYWFLYVMDRNASLGHRTFWLIPVFAHFLTAVSNNGWSIICENDPAPPVCAANASASKRVRVAQCGVWIVGVVRATVKPDSDDLISSPLLHSSLVPAGCPGNTSQEGAVSGASMIPPNKSDAMRPDQIPT